jgi:hypothetical protein
MSTSCSRTSHEFRNGREEIGHPRDPAPAKPARPPHLHFSETTIRLQAARGEDLGDMYIRRLARTGELQISMQVVNAAGRKFSLDWYRTGITEGEIRKVRDLMVATIRAGKMINTNSWAAFRKALRDRYGMRWRADRDKAGEHIPESLPAAWAMATEGIRQADDTYAPQPPHPIIVWAICRESGKALVSRSVNPEAFAVPLMRLRRPGRKEETAP